MSDDAVVESVQDHDGDDRSSEVDSSSVLPSVMKALDVIDVVCHVAGLQHDDGAALCPLRTTNVQCRRPFTNKQ